MIFLLNFVIPGSRDCSITSDEESSICMSSPDYQHMSSDDELRNIG